MDAALVREGVPADDRLVVLHREGRHRGNEPRGACQHRGFDAGRERIGVAARLQRHHDLLERRVAGPLADAVDGAFDLPGARLDARDGVGHREAEVVVAMDREDRLVAARHALAHGPEHGRVFGGRRIAHRVGQVDGGGAGLDRRLDAAAEIVERRAGRVHGRPFDVVDEAAGLGHGAGDDVEHLVLRLAHLVREMDRRGRHEGVDARPLGVPHRGPGARDVGLDGPGQARHARPFGAARDFGHGLEVAVTGDREAGLDDVDPHMVEQFGHLELVLERHGGAGALLAVAQGGVEDENPVLGRGG